MSVIRSALSEYCTYQKMLFPEPAAEPAYHQERRKEKVEINIRFPWIHNSEPSTSHSWKVVLSMNHVAVPSW